MLKRLGLLSSLCLAVGLTFPTTAEEPLKELTLATTTWCPYTCFDSGDASDGEFGVVGQYVDKLLSTHNIKLKASVYPWSRAIHLANSNKVDGLLTAAHSEAPALIFSSNAIASYQMCFYTLKTNQWQFKESLNFAGNKLAVIQDYSYDKLLDTYIENNTDVIAIFGSDVTERLLQLLFSKRADIIVVDKLVLAYISKHNHIDISQVKNAGCLAENDFYLALTPTKGHQALLNKLERELALPENKSFYQGLIKKIL